MKYLPMTPLKTTVDKVELIVPGSWLAPAAEVTPDAEWLAGVTRYWMADGYTPRQADEIARRVAQAQYEHGHIHKLRMSIAKYARKYYRSFPHLRREDGTLAGFDPARMAGCYMALEHPGGRGKPAVRELFTEFAKEAEDAARAAP